MEEYIRKQIDQELTITSNEKIANDVYRMSLNGDTSTSVASTFTGGTIICKITGNDSSATQAMVGSLTTGSEIRFYEADGITEYTFEDINTV